MEKIVLQDIDDVAAASHSKNKMPNFKSREENNESGTILIINDQGISLKAYVSAVFLMEIVQSPYF